MDQSLQESRMCIWLYLHAPSAAKLAEFCQDLPEQTELKVLKSSVWDTIMDSKIANQIRHLRFDPRAEAGPSSSPARLDTPTWQLPPTFACEPAIWRRNREEWKGSLQIVFPGRCSRFRIFSNVNVSNCRGEDRQSFFTQANLNQKDFLCYRWLVATHEIIDACWWTDIIDAFGLQLTA